MDSYSQWYICGLWRIQSQRDIWSQLCNHYQLDIWSQSYICYLSDN
ncbi:MAG: hypothetical protein LUO89_04545 [Methanothrix sp.]|nr:hypothetical protein [Methanothrix sp.]